MITKTELKATLEKTLDVTMEDLVECARFIRCYCDTEEYPLAVKLHEQILSHQKGEK